MAVSRYLEDVSYRPAGDGCEHVLAAGAGRGESDAQSNDLMDYVDACMEEIAAQTTVLQFLNARMGGALLLTAIQHGDELTCAGLQVN